MNMVARAWLLNRPNLRPAVNYGFDETEAAVIKDDFPSVEILFDIDRKQVQVWGIGEYGAEPICLHRGLARCEWVKLHDMLRKSRVDAAAYRAGEYGARTRARLERESDENSNQIVNSMDPDKMGTEYLNKQGRVRPVSQAVAGG